MIFWHSCQAPPRYWFRAKQETSASETATLICEVTSGGARQCALAEILEAVAYDLNSALKPAQEAMQFNETTCREMQRGTARQ